MTVTLRKRLRKGKARQYRKIKNRLRFMPTLRQSEPFKFLFIRTNFFFFFEGRDKVTFSWNINALIDPNSNHFSNSSSAKCHLYIVDNYPTCYGNYPCIHTHLNFYNVGLLIDYREGWDPVRLIAEGIDFPSGAEVCRGETNNIPMGVLFG